VPVPGWSRAMATASRWVSAEPAENANDLHRLEAAAFLTGPLAQELGYGLVELLVWALHGARHLRRMIGWHEGWS
jgi:hypothetical protein